MLRRLVALLLCALLCGGPVAGQMMPGISNAMLMGAVTAKIGAFQGQSSQAASTVYTFSAQPIGTVQSDRYIVLLTFGFANSAGTVSGVTLDYGSGAIAMAQVGSTATNANVTAAMWILNAPSGNTTGTFVVTFTSGKSQAGIGIYTITGLASATPAGTANSTAANPTSGAMTTLNGGVMIGGAGTNANSSFTWTTGLEDFDVAISAARTMSGASLATTGSSTTFTATPASSSSPVGVFASW